MSDMANWSQLLKDLAQLHQHQAHQAGMSSAGYWIGWHLAEVAAVLSIACLVVLVLIGLGCLISAMVKAVW